MNITPESAKSLMDAVMKGARQDIANNDLSSYMRGYYIGCLFAYANVSRSAETEALYEQYRAEVRHALQVAA